MRKTTTSTDAGRRLATVNRGERSELRFSAREYHGNPYLEISRWENRRGRMRLVSSTTIRKSEIGHALAALSEIYLLTIDKEAQ